MALGSKRYCFNLKDIKEYVKYASLKINDSIKEDKPFEEMTYQQCKVDWELELLYLPFAPKEPVAEFADKGGKIFTSKKTPLMIVCNLATEKESEAAL